ncbi:MAG: hypothetical protein CM1200mP20_07590 [Pseudomonadota bacterium]|nr:MAG: hypothetical protein CM1200mP20_07590 [Pseudomonadota bacterium]
MFFQRRVIKRPAAGPVLGRANYRFTIPGPGHQYIDIGQQVIDFIPVLLVVLDPHARCDADRPKHQIQMVGN